MNPTQKRSYMKAWRKANPDKCASYTKQWAERNPGKVAAKQARLRAKHGYQPWQPGSRGRVPNWVKEIQSL